MALRIGYAFNSGKLAPLSDGNKRFCNWHGDYGGHNRKGIGWLGYQHFDGLGRHCIRQTLCGNGKGARVEISQNKVGHLKMEKRSILQDEAGTE